MRFQPTLTVVCSVCGRPEKNGSAIWIPQMQYRCKENAQPIEMDSYCLICATAYFGQMYLNLKMRELLVEMQADIEQEDAEIDEAIKRQEKVSTPSD